MSQSQFRNRQTTPDLQTKRIIEHVGFSNDAPERRVAVNLGRNSSQRVAAANHARGEFGVRLAQIDFGVEKLREADTQRRSQRLARAAEQRETLTEATDHADKREIGCLRISPCHLYRRRARRIEIPLDPG